MFMFVYRGKCYSAFHNEGKLNRKSIRKENVVIGDGMAGIGKLMSVEKETSIDNVAIAPNP